MAIIVSEALKSKLAIASLFVPKESSQETYTNGWKVAGTCVAETTKSNCQVLAQLLLLLTL